MSHLPSRVSALGVVLMFALLAFPPSWGHAQDDRQPSFSPDGFEAGEGFDPRKEVTRMSDEDLARYAAGSPDRQPRGFQRAMALQAVQAGLEWTFLGPWPILNEYYSGNKEASGRVCSIAVDPLYPNMIYVAAAQGGVWKSVDAGSTWMPLTDGLSSLASGALALDPSNHNILYYGTGEQHYSNSSFYGDGLFRSPDGGANWFKIGLKSSVGSYIARVGVKPTNGNVLYVASDLGFVRSADGGATWQTTLSGGHCTDMAVVPNSSIVYAAIRGMGIYRSTDDGQTWTLLGGGLPTSGFLRINFAVAPSNPNVLYASFVDGRSYCDRCFACVYCWGDIDCLSNPYGSLLGMYKSTDAGLHWTRLSNTKNYLGRQGWYDNCLVVDPQNPSICYAGGVYPYYGTGGDCGYLGVIKTTNGGGSWTDISLKSSVLHPDQHYMTFGSDHTLWVANDGGVWKSTTNGKSWVNCNPDLKLTQFYTTALHPTNASFLLGGTQDNGSVRYSGLRGWRQVNSGDGGPSAVNPVTPNIYYTTAGYADVIYRWDNGTLKLQNSGPPWRDMDRISPGSSPLLVDPNTPTTLLHGTYRVWKSTDSGASWNVLNTSPTDLTSGGHLRALAAVRGMPNLYYSASSTGLVYLTTDGATWTERSAGLPTAPLPDLALDPSNWQRVYACADQASGGRVFLTENAGVSWTSRTGDLPSGIRALSLAVDFRTSPHHLYLGTDYGVYLSTDAGSHWQKSFTGIPNCAVYDMGFDTANDRLVVATHGRGEWSALLDASPPVATLASPNGGEAWRAGTTHTITWSASDNRGVTSISLVLSPGIDADPVPIASGLSNTGSYSWVVPNTPSSNCRVEVLAYDVVGNVGSDTSDGDFTIFGPLSGPLAAQHGPRRLVLHAIAPNPAQTPLDIGFELPSAGSFSLEIFDVAGRRVRAWEGKRAEGSESVSWDGRDESGRSVTNGIYFYRLRAAGRQLTRRVTLMR